ncbi:MAG: efflux RND transporter permease subunit [Acidobacteria bacterium]|nr:efflux RND transporter permease subunit [Acidobacteriota bacterium]
MKLADVSVRRPVFAVMMSAALIVLGWFSYRQLGLDLMPKTDYPTVTVSASLPGASAEEIETTVTKPIEAAVNTINGIDELRCSSSQGNARCSITFVLEREIEAATQDVRDKVAGVHFPRDTDPPSVTKMDPDSAPVITIVVYAKRAPKELTQIADTQIKQVLETVQDVGEVSLMGNRRREIRVLLNPSRLNAYSITTAQVASAVGRQNIETPGGSFTAGPADISMRTMGRLRDVRDFERIVLAYKEGSVVTVGDVARVTDSNEEVRSQTRLWEASMGKDAQGENAISLSIRKQSGTNTVEVVDRVLARLDRIKLNLPADISVKTTRDQSRYIRKSFEEIQFHLVLGGLFAALVVFFFIRNIRVTLIAAVAIPTSIIGTFTAMKALGFTLNNMTMLSLSLATGIVIDDAIVVLENIFRYIEEKGVSPKEAAMKATGEIGLAVMATTLSLVVIFLPVAFMTGQVGRYFYSFGISSATAIMISMFVSFTLTPALCAHFLRAADARQGHQTQTKQRGFYAWMDKKYGVMLEWSLAHRRTMLAIAGGVAVSAALLYPYVGKELVPDDDQSEFSANLRLPRGTSFNRTLQYVTPIEGELRQALGDNLDAMMVSIQNGSANYSVQLTPITERTQSQQQLMQVARRVLGKYRNARTSVSGGTDISGASSGGGPRGGGGSTNRLTLILQGPDVEELQKLAYAGADLKGTIQMPGAASLLAKLREINGVTDSDTSFEPTQPELRITIDRQRAADMGVPLDTISSTLRTLVGGEEVSKFKDGDEQYSVTLRLDDQFRQDPQAMGDLVVPASGGRMVRVNEVATLALGNAPASIDRYNRMRQISVNANLDPLKIKLGDAISQARVKVGELDLKAGYQVTFGGSAKTLSEAGSDFVLVIILSIVFIYMVLASQFNSFVHPLTIMTALPLSLPAGLLTLMLFGMTINVYSAIGLMMLFGIVKKNSILQVDYTNTLRAEGMERHAALMAANHVRLRPILMTTLSIVAGMLPIAFGRGAGSGSRASMAVTIIGGQILCLLLTLLITPVVYSYFDDLREVKATDVLKALFSRLAGRRAAREVLPGAQPTPEPQTD